MVMNSFQFAGTPVIYFGNGMIAKLVDAFPKITKRVLFVMGGFQRSNAEQWESITTALSEGQISYDIVHIHHEPTAEWVDKVVDSFRVQDNGTPAVDAVVAIGGGSAMDAGKAVSAMLRTRQGDTIMHYLEGQPAFRQHSGNKVFFAAVPTTSGTGSEMTKNAVISISGGLKRSIRHDRFIPDVAIVDPLLTISCPRSVKAASGLDALTQLIESYISVKSSPLTDALALSSIEAAANSLLPICTYAEDDAALHGQMAYASMLSGITLAHAGLGLVHGFASPLGGLFSIPHGVVCGTLLAEVTKRNIVRLKEDAGGAELEALTKYAKIGSVLAGKPMNDINSCLESLITNLEEWTAVLQIPRLGQFGVNEKNIDPVICASDNKQSPVQLDRDEMREILMSRI